MLVQGCDCSIVIKTGFREMGVPYAEETIREAVSLLQEQASIEGDGVCGAVRKINGVTGCVVTPLTTGTAPLLLYLAMGCSGAPLFVSETRNLYQYKLNLQAMENGPRFDLIQERGDLRTLYENCGVSGFELRIHRGEAVKLKLDITSERKAATYPYTDQFSVEHGERFNGDFVSYRINGKEYRNIYGLTITAKKEGGTQTEIWIMRTVENGGGLPDVIEELSITAQLNKDHYEYRRYGMFRLSFQRLVLLSDETAINCAGAVIGPVRYYVAGSSSAEVFTADGGRL